MSKPHPFDIDSVLQQQMSAAEQTAEPSAEATVDPVHAPEVDLAAASTAAADIPDDVAAYAASAPSDDRIELPPMPREGEQDTIPAFEEPRRVAVSPQELERVKRAVEWGVRQAGGGALHTVSRRLPLNLAWDHLEDGRSQIDTFESMFNAPAPAWFLRIAQRALRDIPRIPDPRPRTLAILERAHGGQLLRTLFAIDPAQAINRLELAAKTEGLSVDLGGNGGLRLGEELLRSIGKGEQVLAWATEAGVREEETQHVVMSALAVYPPTADWVNALNDEMAAVIADGVMKSNQRGGKIVKQQQAVALTLAVQRPEVFAAIPEALAFYQRQFRGAAGRLIDEHFPSRVLLFLRSKWVDQTADPRADLAPYIDATPARGTGTTAEGKLAREQFQRNYALLALGGIGDDYHKERGGRLFHDLIHRDFLPRDERGALQLPEEVQGRINRLLSTVRRRLQFEPVALAEDYRFLVNSNKPESQLKGIGMYLSALPYRQHLLGPGGLSLWPHGVLTSRFAKLLEASYRTAPAAVAPQIDGLTFADEDRTRVREATGLRLLLDNDRLSELAPLITWLTVEARTHQEYVQANLDADKRVGLAPGTATARDQAILDQLATLPSQMREGSVGSYVLGMVCSGGADRRVAIDECGTPPDVATLFMITAMNVALDFKDSPYLNAEGVSTGYDATVKRTEKLGLDWKGSLADWAELGSVLGTPVFQQPLSPVECSTFARKLVETMALDGADRMPTMTYSTEARASLARVLTMPSAPTLLRGRGEAEPAHVIVAAAVLANAPNTTHVAAPFWRKLVQQLQEDAKMLGQVHVVPAPERSPDGSYRRPNRGAVVTAVDFENPAQLVEIAARITNLEFGHELELPPLPTETRNWEAPDTWLRAAKTLDRNLDRIASLFGAHVQATDLPRILEHGATLAEKEDLQLLLRHAGALAANLFQPHEPSAALSGKELATRTRELLESVNKGALQLAPEQGLTSVSAGKLTAASPHRAPNAERPSIAAGDQPVEMLR